MKGPLVDGILTALVAITFLSIVGLMRAETVHQYRYRDCVVEIKSGIRLKCRDRTLPISEGLLANRAQISILKHNAEVGCTWIAEVSLFDEKPMPGSLQCALKL